MTAAEHAAFAAEAAGAALAAIGLAGAAFRRHAVAAALGGFLATLGAALFAAARAEPSRRALALALLAAGAALACGALAAFARWRRLDRTSDLATLERDDADA